MADLETGSLQPQGQQAPVQKYTHPVAALFHVLFKGLAIAAYILCGLFSNSFVINFVVIILLLALDFWTVKNVTGRLMVGLRWWNEINDNGESIWRFESLDPAGMSTVSNTDAWLFWWTSIATPIAWIVLGVMALLKFSFDYLLIVAVAIVLNMSNIIGYYKCRSDAKGKIQELANQAIASTITGSIATGFQNMMGMGAAQPGAAGAGAAR